MTKLNQLIEYSASKSLSGGFKPSVYVNGKWCYSITRNAKTMRGALSKARRLAEDAATQFPSQYNNITIKQRG
jgi:hypothetical protein